MKTLDRFGLLIARFALAPIFIMTGFSKLVDPVSTGQFIAAKGLPGATLLALAAGLVEVAGGASLLLGFQARWGALALVAFLVPVTLLFHNPIGLEGMAADREMIELLKNVAICGGLLSIAAVGSGPSSLDATIAAPRVGGLVTAPRG